MSGKDDDSELSNILQRARALRKRGMPGAALALIASRLAAMPESARALVVHADVLRDLHRHEEAAASYRKALAAAPDSAAALHGLGQTYADTMRYAEALDCFDRTLAIKPDSFGTLFTRGQMLRRLGRNAEAISDLDRALALKPDFAEVHAERADAAADLKRYDEALAGYRRALALRPDYAIAHNNLGYVFQKMARYADALACYDKAIASGLGSAILWNNRGNALQYLNRHAEAVESLNRAVALKPQNADYHWSLSRALLCTGDFRNGWAEYEWRWKKTGFSSPARNFEQPIWLGKEALEGTTILLHAEQGLGDVIQFVRYAPLVAKQGARVILEVPALLKPLLETLAGVAKIVAQGEKLPEFDCHCPLLSLPLAFGTTPQTIPADIPYLSATQDKLEAWRRRLGERRGFRVGICWAGNPTPRHRSIPLSLLAPCLSAPGVEFVSLQKEMKDSDVQVLESLPGIANLGKDLRDFSDTAALVSLMELVICVDTSILHVAGALGRPVWCLLPFASDWRWPLDREGSQWYPSARVFRQLSLGRWEPVIGQIGHALRSIARD